MSERVTNVKSKDLLQEIEDQNTYCGVSNWRDKGFTGKGIVVWNTEGYTSHGCQTHDRILDAAPDAIVLNGGLQSSVTNDKINYYKVSYQETPNSKEEIYEVEDFIKKFNVKIITRSMENELGHRNSTKADDVMWCELQKKYNLIMFDAADNDGDDQRDESGSLPILVQGAVFVKGKPVRAHYSSTITAGDTFISFVGWAVGTSFSCPYMAGMTALLLERYGKDLTQEQVVEYYKAHCEDLGDEGYDRFHGYGLAMLGDINEDFFGKNDNKNESQPELKDEYGDEEMKKTDFKDVKEGAWFEDAVAFVVESGYMSGFKDNTFRPNQSLTRAQMAQVLYNIFSKK